MNKSAIIDPPAMDEDLIPTFVLAGTRDDFERFIKERQAAGEDTSRTFFLEDPDSARSWSDARLIAINGWTRNPEYHKYPTEFVETVEPALQSPYRLLLRRLIL